MSLNLGTISADIKLEDDFSNPLEKVLGITQDALNEVRAEMQMTAKIGQEVEAALQQLGITMEEYQAAQDKVAASQKAMNDAMNAAQDEANEMADAMAAAMAKTMDAAHEEALAMNKAMEESTGSIEKLFTTFASGGSIKDVIGAFVELPAAAVAAAGAVGVVSAAIVDLAGEAESLQNKSLTLGLTTGAIQSMQRLAEESNVSSRAIEMSLLRVQSAASKNTKAFQEMGLSQQDFLALGSEGQLKAIADHIMSMGSAAERTAAATALLGRNAAMQLMPVLKELNEGVLPQNVGLTEEQIAGLAELDDAVDAASGAFTDFKNQGLSAVAAVAMPIIVPALNAIAAALRGISTEIRDVSIPFWTRLAEHVKNKAKDMMDDANILLGGGGEDALAADSLARGPGKLSKVTEIAIGRMNAELAKVPELGIMDPLKALDKMNDDLMKSTGQTFDMYVSGADKAAKKQEEAKKATEKHEKALAAMRLEVEQMIRLQDSLADSTGFMLDPLRTLPKDMGIGSATGGMNIAMANAQKMLAQGFSADTIFSKLTSKELADSLRLSPADAQSVLAALGTSLGDAGKKFDLKQFTTGLVDFGAMFGADFGAAAQTIGNIGDEYDRMNAIVNDTSGEFSQAEKDAAAFEGKLNMAAAAGSLLGDVLSKNTNPTVAKLGGAMQGAATGAQMGMAFGPWGAVIGGVVGAIGGFIMAGQKMIKMINDQRDAFIENHGGWEQLQKDIAQFTDKDLLKKLFDADEPKEYAAAVKEISDLLNTGKAAQENLTAAVERYGFTLEEMPMKMRQDEINAGFGQMLQDFELLKTAGFDVNVVLEKMAPNMSAMVNQAVSAGATVPEAMRPIIEQMIAQGKLLDENGEAYESVEDAGITFAQTMDEKFTTLIDKITQMVNALLGIPTSVNTNVNVHTSYTSSGRSGDPEPPPWTGEANAEGGIVTSPRFSLLGEHGPEAIIPTDELSRMKNGAGADFESRLLQFGAQQTRSIVKGVRDALLKAN